MVLRIPIIGTPFGDTMNFLNDTIQLAYSINSGGGNDVITGANLSDIINGGTGNDLLSGAGGDDFLFGGDGNDVLSGGQGNDALSGGANSDQLFGGSGNDSLNGGSGIDLLAGSSGRDVMTGGSEADSFRFDAVSESARGSTVRDIITDFVRGQDRINIDPIDANRNAAGDQDFTFIGEAQFSQGVAGQVRASTFVNANGQGTTVIQADVNGDRVADMEIQLTGNYTLGFGDFDL